MSNIETVLNETRVFEPSAQFVKQANVSGMEGYQALCKAAEKDYPGYWAKLARETLIWEKPFTKILDESNAPFFKWFEDGELNVSYNCLDKHNLPPSRKRLQSFLRPTMVQLAKSLIVNCTGALANLPTA